MGGGSGADEVGSDDDAERVTDTAASLLTFENAPLPLGVLSPAGTIVLANRAMRVLLGYEFAELLGRSVFDVALGDRATMRKAWAERINARTPVTPERSFRVQRFDGTEMVIRASSSLVTDSRGRVRYVVVRAVAREG